MSIIAFFICIWYLAGGIALYYKIFTSGVEYFGYAWTVLVLGLTKFYTDEIFFWPKNSSEIHKINFALNIIYAFVVIFVFRRVNSCAIFYRFIFFYFTNFTQHLSKTILYRLYYFRLIIEY